MQNSHVYFYQFFFDWSLKILSTNSIIIIITINSWDADCNRVSLSKNSNIVLSKLHLNSFPFVRYPVVVSTLFFYSILHSIIMRWKNASFDLGFMIGLFFFFQELRFCKMGWNNLLPFLCFLRRSTEFGAIFNVDMTLLFLTSE